MAWARGQSSVFPSKKTSLPLPKPTPCKFHLATLGFLKAPEGPWEPQETITVVS